MLARFLLFVAALIPLGAQDLAVSQYLDEIRAKSAPTEDKAVESAARKRMLAILIESVDRVTNPQLKINNYLIISRLEQDEGDPQAAIASLRKAHELSPENVPVICNLAELLAAQGQEGESAELYRHALGVDPHDVPALVRRAAELADSNGDVDVAVAAAQLAAKLSPKDWTIVDLQGRIDLRRGRPKDAMLRYTRLVANAPDISTYHYHLAEAFAQTGDKGYTDYERDELEAALKCNPPDGERGAIEKMLAGLSAH